MPYALNYVIWDVSPEIFSVGWLTVRWYGLLFASGFLIGQWIVARIFKIEEKPEKDLEALMIYMVLSTIIGARLGHCLFYQPDYFLSRPIEILYVWEGGLASHGAAIGILIALYLYARPRKDQSFFWVVDRIVIVVALGGCFIRLGNLMNSEIIGKPADIPTAFVFANTFDQTLSRNADLHFVKAQKRRASGADTVANQITYTPLEMDVYFDKNGINADRVKAFVNSNLPLVINDGRREISQHYHLFSSNLNAQFKERGDYLIASFRVYAVPRHPAQLYESISSFLIFLFLLWIYSRRKGETPEGLLFGIFMIGIFTLRFFYEFLKENQVAFEDNLTLNMGQILSIPAVLIGIAAIVITLRNQKQKPR